MEKHHQHEGHQHTEDHNQHDHHAHQAAVDQNKHDHQVHQDIGHEGHQHGHGVDHSGHEEMFRRRFWFSLILSIPVLVYSQTIQGWLGFTAPVFPGNTWVVPVFSILIFIYGGIPFIQMALPN